MTVGSLQSSDKAQASHPSNSGGWLFVCAKVKKAVTISVCAYRHWSRGACIHHCACPGSAELWHIAFLALSRPFTRFLRFRGALTIPRRKSPAFATLGAKFCILQSLGAPYARESGVLGRVPKPCAARNCHGAPLQRSHGAVSHSAYGNSTVIICAFGGARHHKIPVRARVICALMHNHIIALAVQFPYA